MSLMHALHPQITWLTFGFRTAPLRDRDLARTGMLDSDAEFAVGGRSAQVVDVRGGDPCQPWTFRIPIHLKLSLQNMPHRRSGEIS
jgi:hypothetical protein